MYYSKFEIWNNQYVNSNYSEPSKALTELSQCINFDSPFFSIAYKETRRYSFYPCLLFTNALAELKRREGRYSILVFI